MNGYLQLLALTNAAVSDYKGSSHLVKNAVICTFFFSRDKSCKENSKRDVFKASPDQRLKSRIS